MKTSAILGREIGADGKPEVTKNLNPDTSDFL